MATDKEHPLDRARALAREALESWRGTTPDRSLEACDHALNLLLPIGPTDALADVLRWKGSVLRDRGSYAASVELYNQSLTVSEACDYPAGRAHALNCLGTVAQLRGELPDAERLYGDAARLAHRLGDRRLSAMIQQNLGILAEEQGRTDEAVAHFRLALIAFEQESERNAALWVLNNLGVLYTREHAYARASDALERARQLAHDLGDFASEGIVEENRSTLYLSMRNFAAADESATRAYGVAEQRRDNTRRAGALRALARVARARDGASRTTLTLFERALALSELTEDALLRVEILNDLAQAYEDCAERGRAREHWRRALDAARRGGFTKLVQEIQLRLRRPTPHEGAIADHAGSSL
jgi:tetratricopeptide (TPR) repeat protein